MSLIWMKMKAWKIIQNNELTCIRVYLCTCLPV
jgi:hypothetical protein